jgi:hypothetical protein
MALVKYMFEHLKLRVLDHLKASEQLWEAIILVYPHKFASLWLDFEQSKLNMAFNNIFYTLVCS